MAGEILDGIIADEIRQFGLSEARISYAYSPRVQSIVFQGRNLGDC